MTCLQDHTSILFITLLGTFQIRSMLANPPLHAQYHHILAHDIVPLPSILHLPGAYVGIGYCSCTSDGTAET